MQRLNIDIDSNEFEKYLNKYSSECRGLNYKGFENLIKEIFATKNENTIREYLRNLGYDKHSFPYLYRFFSLHFFSNNPFSCNFKLNLNVNLENILNGLLLEEESKKLLDKNGVVFSMLKSK